MWQLRVNPVCSFWLVIVSDFPSSPIPSIYDAGAYFNLFYGIISKKIDIPMNKNI